ncbi:MAG: hypothetical protein O7E57_17785 [Gammaproteobacteria bacterium]|nr:hypothetical protein [Gammaproteobacteria bacterium]
MEFTKSLSLPEQSLESPNACHAELAISYAQMNDRIRVETKVVNEACIISSGDFTLRVRSTDARGESRTRTFSEFWLRTEDGPIELTRYYPMEGDVDLLWVRVGTTARTACTCDASRSGADSNDTRSR